MRPRGHETMRSSDQPEILSVSSPADLSSMYCPLALCVRAAACRMETAPTCGEGMPLPGGRSPPETPYEPSVPSPSPRTLSTLTVGISICHGRRKLANAFDGESASEMEPNLNSRAFSTTFPTPPPINQRRTSETTIAIAAYLRILLTVYSALKSIRSF